MLENIKFGQKFKTKNGNDGVFVFKGNHIVSGYLNRNDRVNYDIKTGKVFDNIEGFDVDRVLPVSGEWISLDEARPKGHVDVIALVFQKGYGRRVSLRTYFGDHFICDEGETVTHWMYIPDFPPYENPFKNETAENI